MQRARTTNDGAFSLQLPEEVQRWRIRIEYRGDSLYAPVRAERELNARLADVQLRIDVEDTIDLDSPSVALRITAASTAGAHGLEVVISDELGREFARGRVDAAGELEIRVEGAEFGAMGPGRIRVESMPDETRSGSRSERPVLRMRSATLSLERSEDRFGVESVNLHGLLEDSSGPLVARAVDLYLNDELSHTALTNPDGRFVWSPNRLATGEHVFHAAFQSDTPGRPNIRSLPLEVSVTGAGSTRGLLYILALAIAGLAAWRLRRRVMPPPPAAPIPAPEIPQLQLGKSRMTNRPSLSITGTIRDCITSAPLINASLSLDGERNPQLKIDEDGTFQWTAPKAGEYTLEVTSAGYESLSSTLHLPHRGEWSSAVLSLRSLRSAALAPFRDIARDALRRPGSWNVNTNREVADAALAPVFGEAETNALVERVDRAVYGPEPPSPEQVDDIERRIDQLQSSSDNPV